MLFTGSASAADPSSIRWIDESINWWCLGDIQKVAGSEISSLWRPVAICGCCESMHCFTTISRSCCEAICTFSIEISIVLESAGGCCESIINVLESPEGCCEDICTFSNGNIDGFIISRRLLWIHINVLEYPEGCGENICTFVHWNINGFGISRGLLWINY